MLYYNIAGIKIRLDMPSNDYVERRLSAYRVEPTEVDYTLTVEIKDIIPVPDAKVIHNFYYKRYALGENGEYVVYEDLLMLPSCASMFVFDPADTHVRAYIKDIEFMGAADLNTRIYSLMFETFRYMVVHSGGMVFHSSSIISNGQAICFSADSGTGKSTHTSLWREYYPDTEVLNDDSPIIMPDENGGFRAWGCPFSGKTELNRNVSAPLRAIVFVYRGEPHVEVVKDDKTFINMVKQSFVTPYVPVFARYMQIASRVYTSTRMYNMHCDISKRAVDTVKNYLEKENEEKSRI